MCGGVRDSSSLQEGQPEDNRPAKDWILPKETELRVEVENEDGVDIRVCIKKQQHMCSRLQSVVRICT